MRISDWSSDVCSSDLLHLKTLVSERVHETLVAQQDRVAILLRHGHPGPEEESTGGRIGFRPAFDARIVHARWTTGQVDIAADAQHDIRGAVPVGGPPIYVALPEGERRRPRDDERAFPAARLESARRDRKTVGSRTGGQVRLDLGGRELLKKKKY